MMHRSCSSHILNIISTKHTNQCGKYLVNTSMSTLRDKICKRLDTREYPKTICPSEVARELSKDELFSLGCTDWRAAMQPIREQAWTMRQEGFLDITQKGEAIQVGRLEDIHGPIRLRKKATSE